MDRVVNKMTGERVSDLSDILKHGGVVALPTDTFYCLAASATNEGAIRRVFEIKGRDMTNPMPLLIANSRELTNYSGPLTETQQQFVATLGKRFWPGGLSLVLPRSPKLPEVVSAGRDDVAFRVPDTPLIREIVMSLGTPVTGTSANLSGKPPLTTGAEVEEAFGALVDTIVDVGSTPGGPPSTVLDLTTSEPRILRAGVISKDEITACLSTIKL